MAAPIEVPIRDDVIRLGQLLKLAGLVDDGAQAREVIAAGRVTVNKEVDRRRGRQVTVGDIVELEGVGVLAVTAAPLR
ncbi:MAG: RNA-binding S4 domain-containing protein [Nostocoides sp.]